ncbi:MAG: bifunctional diaminohydroxyphosphoribosylaminopyrimidine deaminase/5-amino-6-(5-phosphoribosylamino)uracil reductase RibD [Candidatus Omnitrophica bacterium]|nr:bifunctional diaminohydroxyphosphoribosylaminopyrimidine deaminase/5-amino-6-(5-phosphoribosylamino)uracil reductase RibD [Candidatus Omnitrophota bacterium]
MRRNEIWMRRALELAQKGGDRTRPNPLVGAVVVRNEKLISEGYHVEFGGPHAEVSALRKAGPKARGATLYVTLEPCSSWGKTPPCVDWVIESGIRKAVIGRTDPNPQNHLKGIRRLRQAGIRVETGILGEEAEKQNEAFFKTMRTSLPFVTLKMAQSLDGKIATRAGESRWISSGPARAFVRRLRDHSDAVLIGKNTLLQDDPLLSGSNGCEKPWRVVLDPKLDLQSDARVFQGPQLTLVAVSDRRLKEIPKKTQGKGKVFLPVPETKGRFDLRNLLKKLAALGVQNLLVEGGGEVAWSFIRERLADRLIWIVAPKIIGGRDARTSVEGEGIDGLQKAYPLKWDSVYRLGPDFVFEARLCSQAS